MQVLQQEEQADKDWAQDQGGLPAGSRPRQLRDKWQESVEAAADGSLPPTSEYLAGDLQHYLDRLRAQVLEELGAASRNVVSIYPEEYQPFQVSPAPCRDLDCRTQLWGLSLLPPTGVPAGLPPGGC